MVVRVSGSSMDSNEVHPSKKLVGRVFCVTGRLMDLSEVQFANAKVPNE